MFGHNVPRARESGPELQVHEVFYTIQGEGPFAGDPAVFIRLTGCNLKCWFCDTEWGDENDPHGHHSDWARNAAIAAVGHASTMRTDLAVITGGEPARQDLDGLIQSLFREGFRRVQIETAGTFWQSCFDWPGVTLVVSPKTAKVHPNFRDRKVNWKYVIRAGEVADDGLPSAPMQRRGNSPSYGGGAPARPNPGDTVYLQPVDEHDGNPQANIDAMVKSSLEHGYKAGLQMHKYFQVA